MNRRFPGVTGLLLLGLTACGSGVVPAGSGRLEATATTSSGRYTFSCEPTGPGGQRVVLSDDMTFSCPSAEGQANLTVMLQSVQTNQDGKSETKNVVSVVLIVPGPPSATYSGVGQLGSYAKFLNRSYNGDFTAPLSKNASVSGSFRFQSE